MIRENYKTKIENEVLRIPLAIEVKDFSEQKIDELLNNFIYLGAKTFGQQKIDKNLKKETISDFIKDASIGYGSQKNVFLTLKFKDDESLRLVVSSEKPAFEGGTIYNYEHLTNLIKNLDCDIPIKPSLNVFENAEKPSLSLKTLKQKI